MSKRPHSLIVAVFLFAWFLPVSALAGGPLAVCESGVAFLWPNGGANIPFNPDQGDLGPLTNAEAIAATQAAFDVWTGVSTSTASYTNAGLLPVDVNITNFNPFLNPTAPDGLSAIVFDDTGEIFNLLFGPGSGILGFAGPEWINLTTCEILEGVSFLNGPSFTNLTAAADVMVHEFGHYSNLAHTVVNGQSPAFDDPTGPAPSTFGPAPVTQVETMYPFYFGPGSGTQSLHKDDISMISTLYPDASFAATGTITGRILATNGITRLTGVNVIARNVAAVFADAVSAISSDFSLDFSQADPFTGVYTLRGLTPGASYVLFVDGIIAGGFSTPPAFLPGPEEFWNGAAESNGLTTPDPPGQSVPVVVSGGATVSGIDIIFNEFQPGEPLPVGDDGSAQVSLPFTFKVCGLSFDSVFINANGSLTFGAASGDFSETTAEFLAGPPRIAGLWDDLNAAAGGTVIFDRDANTFRVRWEGVPEFGTTNSNTFAITLKRSNQATIDYGDLAATDGLAGLSCGGAITSGFELETSLRTSSHRRTIDMKNKTAVFEQFSAADNDLDNYSLTFTNFRHGFDDVFESNNSIATARRIHLPFSTQDLHKFSAIDPVGGDVDYYRFSARAGDILAIEVVRGAFDSTLGVFDATTGARLIVDDDSGNGLLSRLLLVINADLDLAVAVSAFPDLDDFDGDGGGGGRYVLYVNRYRGEILPAGDDTATEIPIPFFFPFQGMNRTSVFVNSNGNQTFGAGSTDFSETVPEFLSGPARIAPLWDDLDATEGIVIAERTPISLTLHYVSVPEFLSTSPNYFSTTLVVGGFMALDWGPTARSDALVGLTAGGGVADPGPSDLSSTLLLRTNRTIYEQFIPVAGDGAVDLSFLTRLGVPF